MNSDLSSRASEILGHIVDAYLQDGQPIGSGTLKHLLSEAISPATIRNVMRDLEFGGFIHSPHTSAGRLPTPAGLRFFVDSLMGESQLNEDDRMKIERECMRADLAVNDVFERASQALSGLSSCAGMVLVPKREVPLRQIQFLHIEPGKALAVMVLQDGSVENRLIDVPADIPPASLVEASNYLQDKLGGKTVSEVADTIKAFSDLARQELDDLSARAIEAGVAIKPGNASDTLVIQGTSHMLASDFGADIDEIKRLFELLEQQETASRILQQTINGDGVQIFIGAENKTFQSENVSMIVSTYRDEDHRIIGATGVIGPTRLNYRRIVPLVNYTAQVMSRVLNHK